MKKKAIKNSRLGSGCRICCGVEKDLVDDVHDSVIEKNVGPHDLRRSSVHSIADESARGVCNEGEGLPGCGSGVECGCVENRGVGGDVLDKRRIEGGTVDVLTRSLDKYFAQESTAYMV